MSLLTPAAAVALDARTLRRVRPYRVVDFKKMAIPGDISESSIQQLRLPR